MAVLDKMELKGSKNSFSSQQFGSYRLEQGDDRPVFVSKNLFKQASQRNLESNLHAREFVR